ncbi:MAG: hypothetical protein N3E41_08860 [Thermofilaceae archaeon]|nr:hypothetical protein [Thermofilaceae archaeon]
MLLGKKEIYEDWLKTVEKSRSREENPPETWKFIVEKYYSEYLGTILEIATEVEPVVVEGSSDYTYCFVYKNKLIRAADLRLLETSYRLLLRTVKQGSIPRARWTIAQHATRTISYFQFFPSCCKFIDLR